MKTYRDPEIEDVKAFHQKLGFIVNERPAHLADEKMLERIKFIQEELDELIEASDFNQMADMLDAMVDLVYVIKGTAIMMGLPWEEAWAEVQRANMAKVPGVTHRGNRVDAKKPEGWRPPDHDSVLGMYGYVADDWLTPPDEAGWRGLKEGHGVTDPPACTCETLEDGTVVRDGLCPTLHQSLAELTR